MYFNQGGRQLFVTKSKEFLEIATNKKIQAVEQSIGTLGTGVEKLQNTTNQDLIAGGRTCPNCGQIIKRNAAICRYCGTEIEEQAMVECPFCKELIRCRFS